MSEVLCKEHDAEIALDNLRAAVEFGLSPTGWSLPIEEVASVAAQLAAIAEERRAGFGPQIIQHFLAAAPQEHSAARVIIARAWSEVAYPAAELLLARLSEKLGNIVT